MKKRLFSQSLAFLFCLTLVMQTSCQNNTPPSNDNTDTDSDSSSVEETTKKTANLPDKDFGGTTFDILCAGNWENTWTESYDFFSEGETGEPVNDAVYKRNRIVEDKYNVIINEIQHRDGTTGNTGKGYDYIQKSVLASDNEFDAAMVAAYDTSALARDSYLLDLNSDVPYLDLSNEWWDQKMNEDLTMNGKMFYTTGDISTLDNDCTYCILFNKSLIETYNLDDPYELVKNGTWTIDKLVNMSDISNDLNGDGKYNENDFYGMCVWQDSMMGMVNACGNRFAKINNEGKIELSFNNERTLSMLEKWCSLVFDRTKAFSLYHSGDHIEKMFANNQVIFYTRYLNMVKKYRDMDTDFGILPYPKYDENQENYYSQVAPYGCSFVCVPKVVENLEMTGIILEALAYESVDTVTPAYYDISLEGKMIRDNESSEMLDIILKNRVFDIGLFYQVGGYNERLMDCFRNNNLDIASMYSKYESKALSDIEKINDTFYQ